MKIEGLKSIEKIVTKNWEIEVKPILSTPEMGVIVMNCSEIHDVVARQRLVDEYVLKFCANIDVESVEEYDLLKYNGVIEEIIESITNYDELNFFLSEANQMGNVVRVALDKLVSKIPDEKGMKNLVSKITKQIKEVTKEGK